MGMSECSVSGPNFFLCRMTDISIITKPIIRELKDNHNIKDTQIEYADDTIGPNRGRNEEEHQIAVLILRVLFGEKS